MAIKTLHLRRHTSKGPDNHITPLGRTLAIAEGKKASEQKTGESTGDGPDAAWIPLRYSRIYNGPLPRTMETAMAFSYGLGYTPQPMPAVREIGTDELFREIGTDKFREAAKSVGFFRAVFEVHGHEKAMALALLAGGGINAMFLGMNDGETDIAIGHTPMIELGVWAVNDFKDLPEKLTTLADMEGIVFMEENGIIRIKSKITVEK